MNALKFTTPPINR